MAYQFTIIVPVFNEANTMTRLFKELIKYISTAKISTSVLFVDDGSTDASLKHITKACSKNSAFHFIALSENKGLSTALKAGFDHVESPIIGYMDSDLQTSPEDFDLLLEHIDYYDLVTGYRIHRNDSFSKKIASRFANDFRKLFTKDGLDDTGCPLKVIKTKYAKEIPMFKGLHRFLPAMILLQGGRVKQVPVRHFKREEGKSKFGFWNRSLGPLSDCFVYLWMKRKYISYDVVNKD